MPAFGGCPTEKDSVWGIQWFATAPDSIQNVHCQREGHTTEVGLAYRRCLAGMPAGEWGLVDALECESVAARAVRIKVPYGSMLHVTLRLHESTVQSHTEVNYTSRLMEILVYICRSITLILCWKCPMAQIMT